MNSHTSEGSQARRAENRKREGGCRVRLGMETQEPRQHLSQGCPRHSPAVAPDKAWFPGAPSMDALAPGPQWMEA